jgi:hypothetical protein
MKLMAFLFFFLVASVHGKQSHYYLSVESPGPQKQVGSLGSYLEYYKSSLLHVLDQLECGQPILELTDQKHFYGKIECAKNYSVLGHVLGFVPSKDNEILPNINYTVFDKEKGDFMYFDFRGKKIEIYSYFC